LPCVAWSTWKLSLRSPNLRKKKKMRLKNKIKFNSLVILLNFFL
jgi:hypothetical protein